MLQSRWFALLIVLSAPLLSVIDVFIINIAIPAIREGLHADEAGVQLVIASYLLGYAAFLITGGRFGDHFGKKKIFLWGMAFFTLTSCWCGFSGTSLELNIARFFQGVSASFMVPQTISYIQLLFTTPADRAKAVGWFGITLGLASITGQFLGGALTYFHFFIAGWRLIFFINLPIGLLAFFAAKKFLVETKADHSKKFDVSGVVLLTLALFGLIIPLVQGREHGWPWWSWGALVFSLLLFFIFFRNQRRKRDEGAAPLVNIGLFAFRDFNIGLLCVQCCFMVHNSYLLVSTLLFQNGFQLNAYVTGKLFVLFGLGFIFSSFYAIRLIGRFGRIVVQTGVFIMFLAIGAQIYLFSDTPVHIPVIGLVLLIHGLGAGLVLPSILNITLKSIPPEFAGAASGLYSTIQQAASALGVSLIGGLFFTTLHHGVGLVNYQSAFRVAAGADLVVLVVMSGLLLSLPAGGLKTKTLHLAE